MQLLCNTRPWLIRQQLELLVHDQLSQRFSVELSSSRVKLPQSPISKRSSEPQLLNFDAVGFRLNFKTSLEQLFQTFTIFNLVRPENWRNNSDIFSPIQFISTILN